MTNVIFSRRFLHRACTLVLAVSLGGFLAGCDAVNVHTSASETDVVEKKTATIDVEAFTQADLWFAPMTVPAGEALTIAVIGQDRNQDLARVVAERKDGGEYVLKTDFSPLGAASVVLECRDQDRVKQRIRTKQSSPTSTDVGVQTMATSDDDISSFHYDDSGETVIVEVDYEDDSKRATPGAGLGQASIQFLGSESVVDCSHVAFELEGVSASVLAGGIDFRGVDEAPTFYEREVH